MQMVPIRLNIFRNYVRRALNGADLVIGSRMAGEESKMPLTRRVGNFFFASLLTLLSHQKVTDSASGMRVFKREILEHIYPLPDGLNLTPVMSTRAVHEGINIKEVPIPYSERVGRSKLSVIRDGSIFMQSMLWTVLSYNPVRILGLLGLGGLGIAGHRFSMDSLLKIYNGVLTLAPLGRCGFVPGSDLCDHRSKLNRTGDYIQLFGVRCFTRNPSARDCLASLFSKHRSISNSAGWESRRYVCRACHWSDRSCLGCARLGDWASVVLYGVQCFNILGWCATGCLLVVTENTGRVKPEGNTHEAGYRTE